MPSKLPTHIDTTGQVRVLGTVPTPPQFLRPRWSLRNETLPASELREFDLVADGFPGKVKNQGSRGACVGHAAATSLEVARWIESYPHVDLSAWFVYAILCNGYDVGSSIGEALDLLEKTGTCPDPMVPWSEINPRRLSGAARAAAPRYRVEAGDMLSSYEEMLTATMLRRPGNFSIHVGANFNDLDADGCPPVSRGPGNHAVSYGVGLKKGRRGNWLIKCPNSWDVSWGLEGYFFVSEDHIQRQSYFEAYEVVAAGEDPDDPQKPPSAS